MQCQRPICHGNTAQLFLTVYVCHAGSETRSRDQRCEANALGITPAGLNHIHSSNVQITRYSAHIRGWNCGASDLQAHQISYSQVRTNFFEGCQDINPQPHRALLLGCLQ